MRNPFGRRHFMLAGLPSAGILASAAPRTRPAAASGFNVRNHGASGDGVRLDTKAIQETINACARAGGGTVYFPAGKYLTGTIVLKSHITLELGSGAVLLGSTKLDDYPRHIPELRSYTDTYVEQSLIYAENLENIGICGRGLIDGQGAAFKGPYKYRPYLMRFIGCRDVSVSDVSLRDSPMWVQHYLACEQVSIRGISVSSRVNANNDGIDIDACRRVRISGCDIVSGDDAIVLKASCDRPCLDVAISNCVLSTNCNALKLGTESNGGFEDIAISNCVVYDTRLAGIAIEMVDGGRLERVAISNVVMNGIGTPIFIRLGDRARPFVPGGNRPGVGSLRDVTISNVEAVRAGKTGCAIAGLPGHAIENVTIENVRLNFAGGGTPADARREIAESADRYPEFNMFGTLPAYGFYCRHVRNLVLRNIQTGFAEPEQRPALACMDVEGMELAGSTLSYPADGEAAVQLNDVSQGLFQGCRALTEARSWLRLRGERTRDISVIGNDLAGVRQVLDLGPEVAPDSVFLNGNRVHGA
jgi:polygalacturonase